MKSKHPLIVGIAVCACFTTPLHASLIAFWDFNDGYDAGSGAVQIIHSASQGSGTLYQQRAAIDGNGKGGIAYTNAAEGINASDGKGMAWNDVGKSGENDAEFFIRISTTGYKDIHIRFDVQGNADKSIVSFDLKYATTDLVDVVDPPDVTGTIKDFQGGNSTSVLNNEAFPAGLNDPAYVEQLIDLSTVTAINNQSVVVIRLDDFKNNDAMRIDNILVTGTNVPEPTSGLLALLGSTLALGIRKRNSR